MHLESSRVYQNVFLPFKNSEVEENLEYIILNSRYVMKNAVVEVCMGAVLEC